MRIMEGSKVSAPRIAQKAPSGYVLVPSRGYGLCPGYVLRGPDHDMKTTVVLFPNDDGSWFREAVESAGGQIATREL